MTDRIKYVATTLATVLFFAAFSLWAWFRPSDDFSDSERRGLKQFPSLSYQTVLSGDFMENFEGYTLDQFPMREQFRSVKAQVASNVFFRGDNNGLYEKEGFLSKLDYPLNEKSVVRAAERFRFVYDKYLSGKDVNAYLSVIPDKNAFLAQENGYPSLDYDALYETIYQETDFLTPIELRSSVSLGDFYKTDTHLRQEKLLPLARTLLEGMGGKADAQYETVTVPTPFRGVYYGQSALNPEPDTLRYLTNDALKNCKVFDFQNNKEISVYELDKAQGKDPYELFLGGPLSLVTLENPNAKTDKELILFRDSFGSAVAPLLAEDYRKITLVDIRYLHPILLGNFIEFDSQDVLFLYSTSVLNNSETIK
ncbi:MAG: hypothetical protein IJC26_03255 [Clostridia bacterium]|nr:hypothetical protein [Clostridia bacterium]